MSDLRDAGGGHAEVESHLVHRETQRKQKILPKNLSQMDRRQSLFRPSDESSFVINYLHDTSVPSFEDFAKIADEPREKTLVRTPPDLQREGTDDFLRKDLASKRIPMPASSQLSQHSEAIGIFSFAPRQIE